MADSSSVVLLIEPNVASGASYGDALRRAGYTVVLVPDTTTALQALTEITPHIVVARFDPRTHDERLALCERLKGDARTAGIPILLTSDTIGRDDLKRATEISVLGVSIGPHDGGKMTSAVRGVLAVAEARASIESSDRDISRSA